MNRQVRRVAVVVLVAFLALLAAPLYWQVVAAERLANDPRNTRVLIKEYAIQRGPIVLGDGKTEVARSVRSRNRNDPLEFVRQYPDGPSYGMVTGFYSLVFGRTLAEQEFNSFLLGKAPEQFAQNFTDLVTGRSSPGGTLVLTLDPAAQEAAQQALGDRKGAVVALDYTTGAVLAMTTFPRYDPNDLSSHDTEKIRRSWDQLLKDPDQPLLNRAAGQLYPPGSTFKVVTAAAALENGVGVDQQIPSPPVLDLPQTTGVIRNFGGGTCGGQTITLPKALEISCNTAFANLGLELGARKLAAEARKFGFNAPSPYQLPAATSSIPADMDKPSTAQSAIGQRDVRVSPLQMATVAATVANGGRRLAPSVAGQVVADNGDVVKRFDPRDLGQVIPEQVAADLRGMMGRVVQSGSGTAAKIPGLEVFGKTGTAQNAAGRPPHAWFIGFTESGDRHIAVAVVVENGGDLGSEATGGRVAAPIAKQVMQAYLGTSR
jgi:peptidoglycan glycosyltransferase